MSLPVHRLLAWPLASLPAPSCNHSHRPPSHSSLATTDLQILEGRARGARGARPEGEAGGKGRKRKSRRDEDAGAALLPAEEEEDEEGWVGLAEGRGGAW